MDFPCSSAAPTKLCDLIISGPIAGSFENTISTAKCAEEIMIDGIPAQHQVGVQNCEPLTLILTSDDCIEKKPDNNNNEQRSQSVYFHNFSSICLPSLCPQAVMTLSQKQNT